MNLPERTIVAEAYKLLLCLPLGGMTRHYVHRALVALRDEIARLDGRVAETVQTEFEDIIAADRSR